MHKAWSYCSYFFLKTVISMVSFKVVCEIVMVPDKECNTSTLIVSAAKAIALNIVPASKASPTDAFNNVLIINAPCNDKWVVNNNITLITSSMPLLKTLTF